MRGRSDRATSRWLMVAAGVAFATGCFDDPPAVDETTSGPTSTGSMTDPSTTGPTGTETTTSTTDAPTSSTTGTSGDTTADPTVADSSTSTSSDDGSSTSESTGTGVIEPSFFDDFERPDSQALGNGWVEKLPAVFSIDDGMVAAGSNTPQQYFDQVVYQNDSISDIELRVEFRIDVANDLNEPHLIARQQPDALMSGTFNHCYILVPQLSQDRFCLMRFDSQGFIGEVSCTENWENADLVVGDWYRLVMTIEGPGPVEMTGRLEHAEGEEWVEVIAVEWVDNSPNQISGPGVWGFSGGTTGVFYNNFVFDNFSAYYR